MLAKPLDVVFFDGHPIHQDTPADMFEIQELLFDIFYKENKKEELVDYHRHQCIGELQGRQRQHGTAAANDSTAPQQHGSTAARHCNIKQKTGGRALTLTQRDTTCRSAYTTNATCMAHHCKSSQKRWPANVPTVRRVKPLHKVDDG